MAGARTTAQQVVYRIDPARLRTSSTGFAAPVRREIVTGSGPRRVSRVDTARAAWILSKYGDYRFPVQNAAVEVALGTLLHGGRWGLAGDITERRLASTGRAAEIRSFAATMLRDSTRYAGPYAVTLTSSPAEVGGALTLRVRVSSTRTGVGIANLPVTFDYLDHPISGLTTASDGTASTIVPSGPAGPSTASVIVDRIPEDRLVVRAPRTSGASRVVVAGTKNRRAASRSVTVVAIPTLSTRPAAPVITTREQASGLLAVSHVLPSPRTASASLYGPFAAAGDATCDPVRRVGGGAVPISGDGTYPLPALAVPRYGYYTWGVTLPADGSHRAAASCGGTVLARVVPAVTATPTGSSYRAGAYIQGRLTVSGLPSAYSGKAALRLFGPFATEADVRCDPARLAVSQEVAVTSDGSVLGPALAVTRLGYYTWAADLPGSTFSAARSTRCPAAAAGFRVVW